MQGRGAELAEAGGEVFEVVGAFNFGGVVVKGQRTVGEGLGQHSDFTRSRVPNYNCFNIVHGREHGTIRGEFQREEVGLHSLSQENPRGVLWMAAGPFSALRPVGLVPLNIKETDGEPPLYIILS